MGFRCGSAAAYRVSTYAPAAAVTTATPTASTHGSQPGDFPDSFHDGASPVPAASRAQAGNSSANLTPAQVAQLR